MTGPTVHFAGVWKSYPRWPGGARTVRAIVSRRAPLFARGERLWALRDVSFTAARGESVGVIGLNGSGKSTLLRIASGLGRPSRGTVSRAPDTASVLSLGDSFDLSLSGSENALTAAIVAGMRRAQARACLPAALEFAELEAFADAPVRSYSEGMKLRLAFGVVAQLRPALLVVDEVLAVGDAHFQAKCLERVHEMRADGTTLLLASHALDQVSSQCDRAVWLQGGAVRAYGEAASVVDEYRDAVRAETARRTPAPEPGGDAALELRRNRFGTQELTVEAVTLRGPDGEPTAEVGSGGSLEIAFELHPRTAAIGDAIVSVAIHRVSDGVICYDVSTDGDRVRVGPIRDPTPVSIVLERLNLLPGEYALDVGAYEPAWAHAYDFHWRAYPFRVVGATSEKGIVQLPHRWHVGGERRR